MSMRLNSSKQAQAPVVVMPSRRRRICRTSSFSVVLNTTHCLARSRASSLTVSVLPVPGRGEGRGHTHWSSGLRISLPHDERGDQEMPAVSRSETSSHLRDPRALPRSADARP